jgi:tetratricopeptide (TPR) repeat protein
MESTRQQSNQDQGQLASSSARAQRPSSEPMKQRRPGRPGAAPATPGGQEPESAVVVAKNQASRAPDAPRKAARLSMANLPPPPRPKGLVRLLSKLFGPLQPLRFFWSIARWLWLAAGLIVIGAAAADYLVDLFTGNVPTVNESFFNSPVLEIPLHYPLRFMAGAGLALLLTVLAWGATREHQRRLNARAQRVRQAISVGLTTDQVDDEMRAALLKGDLYGNFQLATDMHEQDRPADAVWLYQVILEQAPKHFGANYNLGLIQAEMEQFDAAEGYCRAAILLNAESAEAQGLTAYVLYRLGLLDEAQRRARLAVRMGFSSQMLESLILPGLGVTSSLPATNTRKDLW